MAYYVLFDTETTGASQEDRVIQFGSLIVDQRGNIEVFDTLEFFYEDIINFFNI